MKPMTGEIGTLSVGDEQVGGFKYWTAIHNRDTGQTQVVASKFWLNKKPDSKKLDASFYFRTDEGLDLAYNTKVTTKFPEYTLEKMTPSKIDMNLGKFDWLGG